MSGREYLDSDYPTKSQADWERDGRADKVWKLVRYIRDELGLDHTAAMAFTDEQWAECADAISSLGKTNYKNPSPQSRAQVIKILTPSL